MGRFEFRSNDIELDFEGIVVTVPGSIEYAKKLEEVGRKMVVWGNDPANAKAGDEVAREYMLDVLDELLGEETMDKIEAERELKLYDCLDMFKYIKDEVMEYHDARVKAIAPQSVPDAQPMAMAAVENRAMRRAKRRR